jgi:hypothetical protein
MARAPTTGPTATISPWNAGGATRMSTTGRVYTTGA